MTQRVPAGSTTPGSEGLLLHVGMPQHTLGLQHPVYAQHLKGVRVVAPALVPMLQRDGELADSLATLHVDCHDASLVGG